MRMRQNFIGVFLAFQCVVSFAVCAANLSSTNSGGSDTSRPNLITPGKAKDEAPVKQDAKAVMPPKVTLPTTSPKKLDYFHPGALVLIDGKWEGSDHLLNLTSNIGIYVTILKPDGETLEISESNIENTVEGIFKTAKINPQTLAYSDQAPLPAFEIEILIYPIDKGYVACCDGRLFESVTLSRFILDPGMAFQAITWEKRTLIVGPKTTFVDQLNNSVKEIADAFVQRFEIFEKAKKNS